MFFRHNEDGSYTYGYEGADGSFKIETKLPNGEVKGKYGYTDETGKLRVVEYGANRYGFQPAGEGITVAPPTLVDETTNKDGTLNPENVEQEQQYIAAPAPRPAPIRAPAPRPAPRPQPQYVPEFAPAPYRSPSPVPSRAIIPGGIPAGPAPVHSFSPAPRPQPQRFALQPAPVEEDITYAEPAPRPAPRPAPLQFAQPAPQPAFRPQPQPIFRPAPQTQQFAGPRPGSPSGRAGGVLDQLAKDYALPSDSAAPLHDISFGYY